MNLLSDGKYHKALEFEGFVAQDLLYYETLIKQWIQIIFNSITGEQYLVDLGILGHVFRLMLMKSESV